MARKSLARVALLLPIMATIISVPEMIKPAYSQTTTGTQQSSNYSNYSYGGSPISPAPVTPTNQSLYGGGSSSTSPLGINLTGQQQQTISSILPALSSLLNGGGTSGLLSSLGGLLSQIPGLSNIIGAVLPVLSSILGGNFSLGGLLSAIAGLLGLGGGGSNITFSSILQSLLNSGTTAAITNSVFGSQGATGQANINSVLAQTGNPLCAYNKACIASNPVPYRNVYATSAGAMGFSNPNEARGNIWEKSKQGVIVDPFSEGSTQNAVYMGLDMDRQIARASTDVNLGKAGQQNTKKAIDAAEKVGAATSQIADKTAKEAKATQDLARGILQVTGPMPSMTAKQIELLHTIRDNGEFHKILLGNISASTDATRRTKDIDNTAIANSMLGTTAYNPKLRR